MSPVDALIIGAGPAGLAAALALARQLHTAVVFDSSLFRNACSTHMHTIPTWDHKDPAAFRGATRKEILERYKTISFVDCEIAQVERTSAGDFAAHGCRWDKIHWQESLACEWHHRLAARYQGI